MPLTASSPLILCRPDRVGDVLIATACLAPIRQQRPDRRLVFVAHEVMRPLLEGHPLLASFIALHDDVRVLGSLFRATQGNTLVNLHPDETCQLAGLQAGTARRIGFEQSRPLNKTLTKVVPDRRPEGLRHEAEYLFDLLENVGVAAPPLAELRPTVNLPSRWQGSLRQKVAAAGGAPLGHYVVVNPTAHSATHRWSAEHFAWLARQLAPHCEQIVLVGEKVRDASVLAVHKLLADYGNRIVNLAGKLNLGELGWLLHGSALLVSRNTGTTHLAAAVDCPTVELFGRLEPAYGPTRWHSLGQQVRRVAAPPLSRRLFETKQAFWQRCYASIPPEPVLAAARELLALGARALLVLFLLAVLSGGSFAQAPAAAPSSPHPLVRDVSSQTDNIRSQGDFGAQLWLVQGTRFFEDWRKPATPALDALTTTLRDQDIYAAIVFYGPARDAAGHASVSYDITVHRPDGAAYSEQKHLIGWPDSPAPAPHALELGRDRLAIRLAPDDPAGLYTVEVRVRDNVGQVELPLKATFTAPPAAAASLPAPGETQALPQ